MLLWRVRWQARVVKQEELLDRNTAEAQRALAEMKAEMDDAKARHEVCRTDDVNTRESKWACNPRCGPGIVEAGSDGRSPATVAHACPAAARARSGSQLLRARR